MKSRTKPTRVDLSTFEEANFVPGPPISYMFFTWQELAERCQCIRHDRGAPSDRLVGFDRRKPTRAHCNRIGLEPVAPSQPRGQTAGAHSFQVVRNCKSPTASRQDFFLEILTVFPPPRERCQQACGSMSRSSPRCKGLRACAFVFAPSPLAPLQVTAQRDGAAVAFGSSHQHASLYCTGKRRWGATSSPQENRAPRASSRSALRPRRASAESEDPPRGRRDAL